MHNQVQILVRQSSAKKRLTYSFKKVQKYSLNSKGKTLNLFVLGLNESSTEEDMKKSYHSMSLRFHPDKKFMKTLQK